MNLKDIEQLKKTISRQQINCERIITSATDSEAVT